MTILFNRYLFFAYYIKTSPFDYDHIIDGEILEYEYDKIKDIIDVNKNASSVINIEKNGCYCTVL